MSKQTLTEAFNITPKAPKIDDLKDYDIVDGVAYPKKKKEAKPVVKSKVISAEDYDKEVEVKKDDKED